MSFHLFLLFFLVWVSPSTSEKCFEVEKENSWSKGFKGFLKVQAEEMATAWNVSICFTDGIQSFQTWKGKVTREGNCFTVTNKCYNGHLYTSQCLAFDFIARHSYGALLNITEVSFNGMSFRHCSDPLQCEVESNDDDYSVNADAQKEGECQSGIPEACNVKDQGEWIYLLDHPCNFTYMNKKTKLTGPKCDPNIPKEKIGVVGGGMAGLTLSSILTRIGHEVVLFEASDRIGGRAYTYYGDGWYGDLGAMRFPDNKIQPLTHSIIRKFLGNHALTNFTNYNQGAASYFYINGEYFLSKEYLDNKQEVLEKIYGIFGIDLSNPFLRDNSGTSLLNPHDILKNKVLLKPSKSWPLSSCLNPESLESFLRKRLKEEKGPQQLVNIWSVLSLQKAFLPMSLWEYVTGQPEVVEEKERDRRMHGDPSAQFTEIRNGTSQLPDAIFKILKQNGKNFTYKLNSKVTESTTHNKQVKLQINGINNETFTKVIIATTSRAASLIKFNPPLPYDKTYALNSFHYMNSVKIFINFKNPFWDKTEKEGNKIKRIRYDCSPDNPTADACGGTGITDLSIRSIYYPSNYLHGSSLLVSYVWGDDDAGRLTSIPDTALIQRAIDDLGQIHGFNLVNNSFSWNPKDYYIKKWIEDEYVAGGAFPLAYPFQNQYMLEALRLNTPPLYFAGEYTAKRFHGWIQAAVASACRVSYEMFGGDSWLVLTGGQPNNVKYLSSSEIITNNGACTPQNIPPLPQEMSIGRSVWINNTLIFCGGGQNNQLVTNKCWSLQPGDPDWSTTLLCGPTGCDAQHRNDMNFARSYFTLTAQNVSGEFNVWAAGGIDYPHDGNPDRLLDTIENYSFSKSTWTVLPTKLPQARFGHCTVNFYTGRKVYLVIIGGAYQTTWNPPTDSVIKIDLEDGTICTLANLPEGLWRPACTEQDGTIYVSGGRSVVGATSKVYSYSLEKNQWSSLGDLNTPRWGHIMGTTAAKQMNVAGGYNSDFLASIEGSSDGGKTWNVRGDGLGEPREYAAMAEVPDHTFACST